MPELLPLPPRAWLSVPLSWWPQTRVQMSGFEGSSFSQHALLTCSPDLQADRLADACVHRLWQSIVELRPTLFYCLVQWLFSIGLADNRELQRLLVLHRRLRHRRRGRGAWRPARARAQPVPGVLEPARRHCGGV